MSRIKISLLVIITLLATTIYAQQAPNTSFLFPMDITPSVSGSFAELRSNHFHSGIDLSTNGTQGIPVKSMDIGRVSRIKVSPVGYGNAVYIQHPNGYTTVYGHLRNYAPKIDSIITAQQYKIESFAIDYFPKEEISIGRGEIIGYSGNSGSSGGPHLHYEIRDSKTEEPVNPYFFQDIITDNVQPKLLTARIYPLSDNSTINGTNKARNYPVVFYDGAYHLKGNPKIYASGDIGIGLEMLDYMSGSWKRCGVYQLKMQVNSQDYYSWKLDRFSFNESRYINSHVDYAYKANHGKRFERCFREPGNHLSIYEVNINDGIIHMDSTKNIQIQAYDAAHNVADLKFTLQKASTTISHDQKARVKHSHLTDHHIQLEDMQYYIPRGSLYADANLTLNIKTDANNNRVYKVGNPDIPLHKNMKLSIMIPKSLKQFGNNICLSSMSASGKTTYAGGTIKNDSILLSTRSFGNYTLAIDTIAPTIRALQNIRGRVFKTHTTLTFIIKDDFSGIRTYNGYLNNKWTLFEYDAKSNKLTCPLAKAPVEKGGTYAFKLIIEDNCGNKKILESNFTIAQQ